MQKLLYKKQRETLQALAGILPHVRDLDSASFFVSLEAPGEVGFGNAACFGNVILLPGPKEGGEGTHLHVEERFSTEAGNLMQFYRYEICWSFERVLEAPRNDYIRDSIIGLRRGVRFDHHPKRQDRDHPLYHWHPNGCSELRLETGKMTPLKVALVAILMFDRERVESLDDPQVVKALSDLRSEIPGLPRG